ncbi:MAG: 1-deoxy-D-xylulose-5-phosphate synthase [Oscillospiraceae bacterium]|nr:1-deoxy-D-xylulose-5-phosphate synthase [Oscillospiraceae bacterium]
MNTEHPNNAPKLTALQNMQLPQDLRRLSIPECRSLCEELRKILIDTILQTGGHLASNLGVVELTLALHRNFDSPADRIVWDVGHQAYVHKILTGRLDQLPTIRSNTGMSGFPKPSESPHDTFITGHSSTAISAAFGMVEAMRLSGDQNHYAVAVVGDGAMTGGMVYEGLNNAGKSKSNLIVILNDNTQAISKNVGAIAKYLSKIRSSTNYVRTKWKVESVIERAPAIGDRLVTALKNTKDTLRNNIVPTTIFDNLGFVYLGPVDGHNVEELDEVLTVAKSYRRPVLVHVRTVKGKGYAPAEKNPGEYHGVAPHKEEHCDIDPIDLDAKNPEVSIDECFSTVFGKALAEHASTDNSIVAVTAAMKYGTGLQHFASAHSDRFYDVGIAEQHAVTFCAALASMGKTPVFAVYSTFLQRAFDQMIHDTAIAGYHIILGVDRAGIVGEDGETHQGLYDVPMLTSIPGCAVYSPATYSELQWCLEQGLYEEKGMAAIRYPRGKENSSPQLTENAAWSILDGEDTLLVTYGRITDAVCNVQKQLDTNIGVLKLTKIFPIPQEALEKALSYRNICFVEEGFRYGGIGEKFAMKLMEQGWKGQYRCLAAEGFIQQGNVSQCLEKAGLSENHIMQAVLEMKHVNET